MLLLLLLLLLLLQLSLLPSTGQDMSSSLPVMDYNVKASAMDQGSGMSASRNRVDTFKPHC